MKGRGRGSSCPVLSLSLSLVTPALESERNSGCGSACVCADAGAAVLWQECAREGKLSVQQLKRREKERGKEEDWRGNPLTQTTHAAREKQELRE